MTSFKNREPVSMLVGIGIQGNLTFIEEPKGALSQMVRLAKKFKESGTTVYGIEISNSMMDCPSRSTLVPEFAEQTTRTGLSYTGVPTRETALYSVPKGSSVFVIGIGSGLSQTMKDLAKKGVNVFAVEDCIGHFHQASADQFQAEKPDLAKAGVIFVSASNVASLLPQPGAHA